MENHVRKGKLIGLIGNNGWSNGPHLHFVVYFPYPSGEKLRNTFKTLFRIGHGDKIEYLEENKSYSKDYE